MSILKKLREQAEPLNVAELAKLLRVTEITVQRWVRRRQIPSIRIGDTIRFDGRMLSDWVVQQACVHPILSALPSAIGNADESRIRWEDLGELAPDSSRSSAAAQPESLKTKTK